MFTLTDRTVRTVYGGRVNREAQGSECLHGESRGTLVAAGNFSPLGKPSSRGMRRVNHPGGLEVIYLNKSHENYSLTNHPWAVEMV